MSNPSSHTSDPTAEKPTPPMSAMCAAFARNAISFLATNTGVTTETSRRCPVPTHGSFVINTSPGTRLSFGICRSICWTV